MNPNEEIIRIVNRFEIAVSNFGQSCFDLQANEKAFQAWYASYVIQEFGISHVYREIHLWKSHLRELIPNSDVLGKYLSGNELFPDVSVSWYPNIDARHSNTRNDSFQNAGAFLNQFSIVSELKVTGSTLRSTPISSIINDIIKLYIFSAAHKEFNNENDKIFMLKCYMVILDNAKNNDGFKNSYTRDRISSKLRKLKNIWKSDVQLPNVVLINPKKYSTNVSILRNLNEWTSF